ncbi:MAG TPA: alpha/beta hydrolase [Vicinamibacterales bacterium]|nr:alpha/beta hydrolase [Vicinamibacterales bacterium]
MRVPVALLALSLTACSSGDALTALDRLQPCTTADGPVDAYCGRLTVFENRDTRQGRTIDLKIVVLPALVTRPQPDPLFFLAGGPGQGAAEMARPLREMFRRVQADRDIVLVDQRGTGKSNPLDCESDRDSLATLNEPVETAMARLRKCAEGLDADLRLYTTTIAMDDLNDVREYLGYDRINLYGGSYGTRAALVYLRRHEPTVRSVILDGVAPPDMRLPLFMARDGQRALDRLLADCEADDACRAQYPHLATRLRKLVTALDASPVDVRLTHPRTGIAEDVSVDGEFLVNVLFGALYSPLTSTLLPELIARAERHDFQGLLALAMVNEGAARNMAMGMQMSVVCAEDYPRITADQIDREAKQTVFGTHLLDSRMEICEFWPRGEVAASYYEPVKSNVPVLVLSGDLDPVTPPEWGESVLPHLPNSKHIVVPATGHGAMSTGCGMRILQSFIRTAAFDELDTSCLESLRRPPFFLTPAGPDPAGSNRSAH